MKKERPIKLTFRITRQEVEQKLNQGKPLSDYHYRWIRKYIKSWNGDNRIVWNQEIVSTCEYYKMSSKMIES